MAIKTIHQVEKKSNIYDIGNVWNMFARSPSIETSSKQKLVWQNFFAPTLESGKSRLNKNVYPYDWNYLLILNTFFISESRETKQRKKFWTLSSGIKKCDKTHVQHYAQCFFHYIPSSVSLYLCLLLAEWFCGDVVDTWCQYNWCLSAKLRQINSFEHCQQVVHKRSIYWLFLTFQWNKKF